MATVGLPLSTPSRIPISRGSDPSNSTSYCLAISLILGISCSFGLTTRNCHRMCGCFLPSAFLAATIFLFTSFTKSFCEENIFTINNVKVKGTIDLNFSRDKYLNKAFIDSFEILTTKILLSRDLAKVSNIKLKQIKNLISSFQILEESYRKNEYRANIKIFYNDIKVKKFLGEKNISFSQPENVSAVFFPVFFIDNEIQSFHENFFYKQWDEIEIKNELINFILPLEDLEDISKIMEMKNKIEDLDVDSLVNKYDEKNYVFVLMNYEDSKLNIYFKTNFNNNKISIINSSI